MDVGPSAEVEAAIKAEQEALRRMEEERVRREEEERQQEQEQKRREQEEVNWIVKLKGYMFTANASMVVSKCTSTCAAVDF